MAAWDEGWAWEEAVRSSPELWLFRVWLCQERPFPASPDVPGTGDQGGGEKTEKENRSVEATADSPPCCPGAAGHSQGCSQPWARMSPQPSECSHPSQLWPLQLCEGRGRSDVICLTLPVLGNALVLSRNLTPKSRYPVVSYPSDRGRGRSVILIRSSP